MGNKHLKASTVPQAKERFAVIRKDRGYGSDLWVVIEAKTGGVYSATFKLRNSRTKEVVTIYQAHCVVMTATQYAWYQKQNKLP